MVEQADENEMVVVDGDTPPPLTSLSLEDKEPVVTIDSSVDNVTGGHPVDTWATQASPDGPASKETRKLRQRKVLPNYEVSDLSDDTTSSSETDHNSDGENADVDGYDTDDLLQEAERVPPLTKVSVNVDKVLALCTTQLSRTGRGRAKRGMRKRNPVKKTKTTRKRTVVMPPPKPRIETYVYDPEQVKELSRTYPDTFWTFHADSGYAMVDAINQEYMLESLNYDMSDQGTITSMTLSPDGTLLATFSSMGVIKLWDVMDEFRLLRRIRDTTEQHIEEFYCGQFNQELMVAGGKLKDRHRWSAEDEDNHILPCPIKIFDLETGKRVGQLEGHTEEILCIKVVYFKQEPYYLSTSQDGYIIKWHMEKDWRTLKSSTRMEDGITCMAFMVSFLPNTGNKYFMAACDGHLRLYDFEEALLLQTFEDIYSSYCDCGKFIRWLDAPIEADDEAAPPHAWFISRGAEMCDVSEGVSSLPNTCTLHRLVYPTTTGGRFTLEQTRQFRHEDYHANSWLVKITSNGRYLLAPTIYGQIFVFNLSSGNLTAILKEHDDIEVRDVIFHPYRPLVFSCADDGCVKVYTYKAES